MQKVPQKTLNLDMLLLSRFNLKTNLLGLPTRTRR